MPNEHHPHHRPPSSQSLHLPLTPSTSDASLPDDASPLLAPLTPTKPGDALPTSPVTPPAPLHPAAFRHVLTALFIFTISMAATITVRPHLLLLASSNDPARAALFTGVLQSTQSLVSILCSPLFGTASDVAGRKPVLILSHLGEFLGLLIIAQFPVSLIMQTPAYIVIAITNVFFTIMSAVVVDVSAHSPIHTTTNYGYFGAVVGLCFFLGPAIGAYFESHFYLASSLHFACVGILLSMLYVYLFVPETRHWSPTSRRTSTSLLSALRTTSINPIPRIVEFGRHSFALRCLGLTLCLCHLSMSSLQSVIYLYVHVKLGWQPAQFGTFLSTLGLSLLLSQSLLVRPLVQNLGERNAILISLLFTTLAFLGYGFATNTTTMYLALLLSVPGQVFDPAVKGLIARQAPPERQGALQGCVSAVTDAVGPFAPIIANLLFGVGHFMGFDGLPFLVLALFYAVAIVFAQLALMSDSLR